MNVPALLRSLHENPETAGDETGTATILKQVLHGEGLDPVADDVGGHGLVFQVGQGAPHRLFRADMDALVGGHLCGHDGHMAMLAGALAGMEPRGTVTALFQPAEETGMGMARCLEHASLQGPFDAVYAFHNVPGHRLGEVLLRPGALGSTGLRLHFEGQTAHAAEPHAPGDVWGALAAAVARIREAATLIAVRYGEEAYGTRPGRGMAAATIRGSDEHVAGLVTELQEMADASDLVDPFPACRNDADVMAALAKVVAQAGLSCSRSPDPFSWSEDFGHALARWPGALIGLGAGDGPDLHDPAYRFPEGLLDPGMRLWEAIASS